MKIVNKIVKKTENENELLNLNEVMNLTETVNLIETEASK